MGIRCVVFFNSRMLRWLRRGRLACWRRTTLRGLPQSKFRNYHSDLHEGLGGWMDGWMAGVHRERVAVCMWTVSTYYVLGFSVHTPVRNHFLRNSRTVHKKRFKFYRRLVDTIVELDYRDVGTISARVPALLVQLTSSYPLITWWFNLIFFAWLVPWWIRRYV